MDNEGEHLRNTFVSDDPLAILLPEEGTVDEPDVAVLTDAQRAEVEAAEAEGHQMAASVAPNAVVDNHVDDTQKRQAEAVIEHTITNKPPGPPKTKVQVPATAPVATKAGAATAAVLAVAAEMKGGKGGTVPAAPPSRRPRT
jgi:hypothetical protein